MGSFTQGLQSARKKRHQTNFLDKGAWVLFTAFYFLQCPHTLDFFTCIDASTKTHPFGGFESNLGFRFQFLSCSPVRIRKKCLQWSGDCTELPAWSLIDVTILWRTRSFLIPFHMDKRGLQTSGRYASRGLETSFVHKAILVRAALAQTLFQMVEPRRTGFYGGGNLI